MLELNTQKTLKFLNMLFAAQLAYNGLNLMGSSAGMGQFFSESIFLIVFYLMIKPRSKKLPEFIDCSFSAFFKFLPLVLFLILMLTGAFTYLTEPVVIPDGLSAAQQDEYFWEAKSRTMFDRGLIFLPLRVLSIQDS